MATRRGTSNDNTRGTGVSQSAGSVAWNNAEDTTQWDELFSGTPYYPLYLSIIQQYSEEVPNTLLGSLTGQDAMNEYDRRQARNQALTTLAAQMQQDKYNSYSNQVAMERQAGLNPDLTGLSGTGKTDGSEFTPQQPYGPNVTAQSQSAMNIFTGVLSSAISMFKQIKEVENLSLQNSGLGLSNDMAQLNIGDNLESTIKNFITNEMAKGFAGQDKDTLTSFNDLKNRFLEQYHGNARLMRIAGRRFDAVYRSTNFDSSRVAYEKVMADRKAMLDFEGKMVEFQHNAEKYGFAASAAKSKSDKSYYDTFDPKVAASAANRENESKGWLSKWRNAYYQELYDDFMRGSDLAGLLLISSGNPSWSGIFGAGLNQADRDISKFFEDSIFKPNDSVLSGLNKLWQMFK